jgi:hypothetical protein
LVQGCNPDGKDDSARASSGAVSEDASIGGEGTRQVKQAISDAQLEACGFEPVQWLK